MIAYAPRDADLTALNQPFEPSRDIYAVAKDVAFLGHNVADIDADPEAHLLLFQFAFIRPLKHLLDLDRTVHRVDYTHKFGEHTIARGVRDPASIPPDQLVDYSAMGGQCHQRRFFVAVHQSAVALDIGSEDRSKMS